ncbi:MAG: butyrate kinase [Marinifilaceae bacterium]
MMVYRILTINPGSTSTKIAVFENEKEIFVKNIKHSAEDIAQFQNIIAQLDYRRDIIMDVLKENDLDISTMDIIVARGGLVRPIPSGVYEVNDDMIKDLHNPIMGEHASNLGAIIANDLVKFAKSGAKAYIADPVVVDEMEDIARISGHPAFVRHSIFHALNQKATARMYADEIGVPYEEMNLIVAHMGGGVSVGAHSKGRVIDVNNALDGEGAFSPERSGTLPTGALVELCFSGTKTKAEIKKMLMGAGGMVAYTGTNDAREVEDKAVTDPFFAQIQDAFCYQVAKEIGAAATVLKGDVDAILLTGGIAYGKVVTDAIGERVEFIAPVKVYKGEDEMRALAMNGLRLLRGELESKQY